MWAARAPALPGNVAVSALIVYTTMTNSMSQYPDALVQDYPK